MNMEAERKRRIALGVILGIMVGIQILVFILQSFFGFLASMLIIPVLAPLIITPAIFGYLGWKGWIPALPNFVILLIMLIGLPLSWNAPTWIEESRFRAIANKEFPIYPGSEKISEKIITSRWSGLGISRSFTTKAQYSEVENFYRRELSRNGWILLDDMNVKRNVQWMKERGHDGFYIEAKKPRLHLCVIMSSEKPTVIHINCNIY